MGTTTTTTNPPPDVAYSEAPISWDAFLAGVERRMRGHNVSGGTYSDNRDPSDTEWFGTPTLRDALELAKDGWHEGTRQIAAQLDSLIPPAEGSPQWELQAAGVMVCIPAYLTGDMECMWRQEPETSAERRVTLITQLGYPAMLSAQHVMNYGIAVTAIMRGLEASGVSPALYAMHACTVRGDAGLYFHGVMIRQHGEPLDLAKIAVSMHPCFSRRLDFAYREQSEGLAPIGRVGYGHHGSRPWRHVDSAIPECGYRIVMPDIAYDLDCSDLPKLIETLRKYVAERIAEQS